ncbi:hypothetical protein LCGC14_1364130 [marine sediment metagenome]|uniref:Uncharacterized protein n=1 Tax=marine sediment metagenome TaxID=412755 RepID=A0A0F9N9C7_9ZZZZ
MFLCDKCHDPTTCLSALVLFRSVGVCENCSKVAACVDCHDTCKVRVPHDGEK